MALSIKHEEADRLARELAATTGETMTEAIVVALRERLERERSRRATGVAQRLKRLAHEVGNLPVIDDRQAGEIIGYGDHGLPA